jgi:hypothetical protein
MCADEMFFHVVQSLATFDLHLTIINVRMQVEMTTVYFSCRFKHFNEDSYENIDYFVQIPYA